MCGLTGLFVRPSRSEAQLREWAERMASTIRHRGPDDSGVWASETHGVAFGYRRLAIVDLSVEGHQPMRSPSGRYWIEFNGEVFNHDALREELRGYGFGFRGHSDTEVILAAIERWGIAPALTRFIGMFAMAIWDGEQRALTLVRDRLGIKPLFIYSAPGTITFASELKALVVGPSFDPELDPDALTAYLRYLYVPAPRCIYRRVAKLLPGHLLTIVDPGQPLPCPVPFWSAADAALHGEDHRGALNEADSVAALEKLLTDSVRLRMQADVPVGALLSGGVDSSTVVALMQSVSTRKVRTYTIGFEKREYDEAAHAAAVARHLGTDHNELSVRGDDVLALVPSLPDVFDEPLADPSQIPTMLVCQLARREVTVALTGDGGDEVFAGYNRYLYGTTMLPRLLALPAPVRRLGASMLGLAPAGVVDSIHGAASRVFSGARRQRLVSLRLRKLARLMRADSEATMYRSLMSACQEPAQFVPQGRDFPGPFVEPLNAMRPRDLTERMILADQLSYLPDDLLAKVDHASMRYSLEARVPLLDHRVVEFAWHLPMSSKIRNGEGKWILRQVLYRHVPRDLIERPKMGFSVPIGLWLRGPLKRWADDLISGNGLRRAGLLGQEALQKEWKRFLGDPGDDGLGLWALLMFLAWQERWIRT